LHGRGYWHAQCDSFIAGPAQSGQARVLTPLSWNASLIGGRMLDAFRSLWTIARHPLNRGRPIAALTRVAAWQLGTRLLPGAVAVPFVESTRLLAVRGMTGATGNIYCGLHEFEDMALALHALRPGDLFVDVGANIGSYTILAAGVVGATCLSLEPVPATFSRLLDNISLNRVASLVTARNVGAGSTNGLMRMTTGLDSVNHVVPAGANAGSSTEVAVATLDALLGGRHPTFIKIDVEGFETEVVNGADRALRDRALLAVLMELNGSGLRYGFDEERLHERMLSLGFVTATYDPWKRELIALPPAPPKPGNVLYVRDLDALRARLESAPRRAIQGTLL
jgi:FkbM family methyltransferase